MDSLFSFSWGLGLRLKISNAEMPKEIPSISRVTPGPTHATSSPPRAAPMAMAPWRAVPSMALTVCKSSRSTSCMIKPVEAGALKATPIPLISMKNVSQGTVAKPERKRNAIDSCAAIANNSA